MSCKRQIVVLTPIKNEAWILPRFLAVTSRFADHIIIADQKSSDGSIAICEGFPKVTVIRNTSADYDEASRQKLLIEAARHLIPGDKILLALDADEILAANATSSLGWNQMFRAEPGTILSFEKPDLYHSTRQCIRYRVPWPIGYVDDGAEHQPKRIHSIRIPTPSSSPYLHIKDVTIIHYALARMDALRAKQRMYAVVENVLGVNPFWRRRKSYSAGMDWKRLGEPESSPSEWFDEWEKSGIDMHTIPRQAFYWQDYEVLRYFERYGAGRFWVDDIWDIDWEQCRSHAAMIGELEIPSHLIEPPPKAVKLILSSIDKGINAASGVRREFSRLMQQSRAVANQ